MSEETITLYSAGSLPGIPGDHAPGTYLVDYEARTIRPATDETSQETPEQPSENASQESMPDVVPVPDLQETPAQESANQ